MKLAILGTRGIPAKYGGFKTFAEELEIVMLKEVQATFYILTLQRHYVYFNV